MRSWPLVLALAACGGNPAPPARPAQGDEPAAAAASPPPGDESQELGGLTMDAGEIQRTGVLGSVQVGAPHPSTPLPPPTPPLFDRLRDDGPVEGLPGFSLRQTRDPHRCGGIAVITTRGNKVEPDNQQLANVFALEFPTGLDFSPDKPAAQKASVRKFQDWIATMQKVAGEATKHYAAHATAGGDPAARARAAARVVQIKYRMASVMARAKIPPDLRTGEYAAEKIEAFCEALTAAAAPLLEAAEAACIELGKTAPVGAWSLVCADPL